MAKSINAKTRLQKEYVADLLKERIYATLALMAVLIGINTEHSSPLNAAYMICGTIVSLWAASIVATQMSRRLIFQGDLDYNEETQHQIRRHAPMLASLVFPLMMIGLSALRLISLDLAINISLISALLLLIGWSIGSARSLNAGRLTTFILVIIELVIGLGVVGLKVLIGH